MLNEHFPELAGSGAATAPAAAAAAAAAGSTDLEKTLNQSFYLAPGTCPGFTLCVRTV